MGSLLSRATVITVLQRQTGAQKLDFIQQMLWFLLQSMPLLRGEYTWKVKANLVKINTKIGAFRRALLRRNGRNMRGFIWMMSLVTMEGQGRFAEVEKMKNRVRYDRLGRSLEVKMENSPVLAAFRKAP